MASCVVFPLMSPAGHTHEKRIKFGIDVDLSSLNTILIFDLENRLKCFETLLSRFVANMHYGWDRCERLESGGFFDGRGFPWGRDRDLDIARTRTIKIPPNFATKLG